MTPIKQLMKTSLLLIASIALSTTALHAATFFSVIGTPDASVPNPAGNRAAFGGTVGNVFSVGQSDVRVTSLGMEDAGFDGLASSHEVGIWDESGSLIANVTVPAGVEGTLIQAWRFAPLSSSVVLSAGATYRIGAHVGGGDLWTDTFDGNPGGDNFPDFEASSDISFLSPSNGFSVGDFANPINDGTLFDGRWVPANAGYTVIPEPVSSLLAILGLAGLTFCRRNRSA